MRLGRLIPEEFKAMQQDLPVWLSEAERILDSPRMRSIVVHTVGWLFKARVPSLGTLLEAWTSGVFRLPCPCGASGCVQWAAGNPMSGSHNIVIICPSCGKVSDKQLWDHIPRMGIMGFTHTIQEIERRRIDQCLDDVETTLSVRHVAPMLRGETPVSPGRDPRGEVVFRYDHEHGTVLGAEGVPQGMEGERGKWISLPLDKGTWRGAEGGTRRDPWWWSDWYYIARDGSGSFSFHYAEGVLSRSGGGELLTFDEMVPPPALTHWIEKLL